MDLAGDEYGYGYGYGAGDWDGAGYGYGYGTGAGDWYGYEIRQPFKAYHYIRSDLMLRNNRQTQIGEALHEDDIKLCKRGLHASWRPEDAAKYAPNDYVLTEVEIWGRVIFAEDKMVATDRRLVRIIAKEGK